MRTTNMNWPAISPLCDKDRSSMSSKDLTIESPDQGHTLSAHVCDSGGCSRCYNEAAGYFDLIGGKPHTGTRQILCESDAYAMYLESVNAEDETWRCPECDHTMSI